MKLLIFWLYTAGKCCSTSPALWATLRPPGAPTMRSVPTGSMVRMTLRNASGLCSGLGINEGPSRRSVRLNPASEVSRATRSHTNSTSHSSYGYYQHHSGSGTRGGNGIYNVGVPPWVGSQGSGYRTGGYHPLGFGGGSM